MSGASRGVADGLRACYAGRNEVNILRRLERPVLEGKLDMFGRALTGEPAVDVEPIRVVLKPDGGRDRLRARPRCLPPGKMNCLE